MADHDLEVVRERVIEFMNEFLAQSGIPLEVSRVDDRAYRNLQKHQGSEIEWDFAVSFLNEEEHFDLAIGIKLDDNIDGVAVGIYREESRILEVQAVESFIRYDEHHPLRGRMVALTVIAAAYFASLIEGAEGVHFLDPLNDTLIKYYERFGFSLDVSYDETCVKRMVSQLDELLEKLPQIIKDHLS